MRQSPVIGRYLRELMTRKKSGAALTWFWRGRNGTPFSATRAAEDPCPIWPHLAKRYHEAAKPLSIHHHQTRYSGDSRLHTRSTSCAKTWCIILANCRCRMSYQSLARPELSYLWGAYRAAAISPRLSATRYAGPSHGSAWSVKREKRCLWNERSTPVLQTIITNNLFSVVYLIYSPPMVCETHSRVETGNKRCRLHARQI